ncbi:hypothetical protein Back11_45500 [Paenibacillus baekrokdamisoli]|uniref:Uncharacterized protein n=1 Tax=Paenibacillus baekrokdamisoli TaxID=1712516 RepID=A0A3G9J4E0_9BACL|nr:hypothetical protein [Paenibacillus baekrokdamisoli]MBB3072335.1 hypothetical protein [Paenibacillus baekrokdamisoli]BBH23205.1 hypothetical protein Back11_45500 [Paenibacillus baekrokdamisoli]
MSVIVGIYFILFPLIAIVSVIVTIIYRRGRLKQLTAEPPFDFQKTDEICIDPTTGIRQQVWFNPVNGERYYQNIDDHK